MMATFRAILDFAGVDPNPGRDPRVRLPRIEQNVVDPPAAEDVDTILVNVPKRWRLPLRVVEQTRMRVGELHALEWGDVDEARYAVPRQGWQDARGAPMGAVPEWLMAEVA